MQAMAVANSCYKMIRILGSLQLTISSWQSIFEVPLIIIAS